ncbi:MAG: 16S rRNA (cytosine(1402)-N(4))-methyltransferase RsmH [Proteobacteria bacterium]|nr:16S rRNA (cytosine(1402)-N(4))-methyltransferase RsmH [Pseudomonadota bacterium]
MLNEQEHKPVLLDEVLNGLNLRPDGFYVDCTFGRGGHSRAILKALGSDGRLLVFDKDPAAIACAQTEFADDKRLSCVRGSFTLLADEINQRRRSGAVDGVLCDLGVSSPQLDNAAYGFSFLRDGELDMRMDPDAGISAAEWINQADQKDIAKVLRGYGEERFARRIATAIIKFREQTRLTSTVQLARLIAQTVPFREKKKDPATRSFLAIRIFINNELDELHSVLKQITDILRPGGRLVVISFHSLEDRIVKRFMREQALGDNYPPEIPVTADKLKPRCRIIGKATKPAAEEIDENPRSRSAVLRVMEKIAA